MKAFLNKSIIFYITRFFPTPTGATYSSIRLARKLRDRGLTIEYLTNDYNGEWRESGTYDKFSVRSFTLDSPGKFKRIRGIIKLVKYLRQRSGQILIFHLHGGYYGTLSWALLSKFCSGSKSVLKITSDEWDTPDAVRSLKWGRLSLWLYRNLDGIVAMTSGPLQKCVDWKCKGKLAMIPNGVDCDVYRPVRADEKQLIRKSLGLSLTSPILVYLGWLGYGKGTDVLLKVWLELKKQFPSLVLLAVGDYHIPNENKTDLYEFVQQHDIPESILHNKGFRIVGHVDDAERYLQASDIFVFPSRKEGFGTVQTEAMACGLPCVVNDLPGVSCDIFSDERHGFRVKNNNIKSFVGICTKLLESPQMRTHIGSNARKRVLEHFSLDKVADQYLAFYQHLVHSDNECSR